MTPTTRKALERASEHFGREITLKDLHLRCHSPLYSWPRFFVMAYLRAQEVKPLSRPQIAAIMRLKDHTSILHGERRAKKLWPEIDFVAMARKDFADELAEIERKAREAEEREKREQRVMRMLNEGRRNFMPWRYLNGAGWALEEAA